MSSGGFWGTRSHKTGFSALVWTLRTAHPAWPLGRSPANRIALDSAQFCAQSAGSGPLLRRMKPVSWRGLLTVASVVGKPLPAVPTRVSDPVCALARGRGRVCGRVGRGGWCGGGVRQCGFSGDGARTRRWLRPPLPRPLRRVGCARSHTRAPPVPGFLLRGPRSQLEATLVWSRAKGMWGPGRPAPLQPSLPPRGAHLELEIIVAGGAFHGEGLGEAEGEQRELRTLEPVLVLCTPGAPIQGPLAPGPPTLNPSPPSKPLCPGVPPSRPLPGLGDPPPTWGLTSPQRTRRPRRRCWHSRSLREGVRTSGPSQGPPTRAHGPRLGFWATRVSAGGGGPWESPEPPRTLLHVVDERLQLGVRLGLLPQRVQDQVVLGGARGVRLPQPSLQQPDLRLLLGHLQPLPAGSKAGGDPSRPEAGAPPHCSRTRCSSETPGGPQ